VSNTALLAFGIGLVISLMVTSATLGG